MYVEIVKTVHGSYGGCGLAGLGLFPTLSHTITPHVYQTQVTLFIYSCSSSLRSTYAFIFISFRPCWTQKWDHLHGRGKNIDGEDGLSTTGTRLAQFPVLRVFIESFLQSHTLALDSPDKNELLLSVLELLQRCVLFGYYSTPASVSRVCRLLIRILDTVEDSNGKSVPPQAISTKESIAVKEQCLRILHLFFNLQLRFRMEAALFLFKQRRGVVLLARLKNVLSVEHTVGTIEEDLAVLIELTDASNYVDPDGSLAAVLVRTSLSPIPALMLGSLQLLNRLFSVHEELLAGLARAEV